jgi:hypothetical protein
MKEVAEWEGLSRREMEMRMRMREVGMEGQADPAAQSGAGKKGPD